MATHDLKRKSPSHSPVSRPRATLDLSAPEPEDDGFEKVKKRKQRKVDKHRPQFQYDTSYFRTGKKIGIAHIRDLSLFVAADAQKPSWIVVDNPSYVTHTVVVFVPGLLPEHLGLAKLPPAACLPFTTKPSPLAATEDLPEARVPTIPKLFSYGCPTRAPGDQRKLHSVMATLLHSPLPEHLKKKRDAETKRLTALSKHELASPLLYVCTANQMTNNGYKLPSYVEASDEVFIPGDIPAELEELLKKSRRHDTTAGPHEIATAAVTLQPVGPRPVVVDEQGRRTRGNVRGEEGWVETPQAKGPPANGVYPVLAIDCEMCLSEDGQELARVSIVELESGKSVFEELVTPPKPVVDYLTEFSGMTAERMSKAKHTLKSIQTALVTGPNPIITPHTILLGHSLDCDLAALKIRHPLVIDTTVIYRHARGPPYKPGLKFLTQKWLGRAIQGSAGGHDSEEDARACVDLLKMKLLNGPEFGDPSVESESIFERLSRFRPNAKAKGKTTLVADHGNPASWYGAKATTPVSCQTDDDVVDAVCEGVASHDYVFARLTELSIVQQWNSLPSGETDMTDMSDSPEVSAALERFDARLTKLHASLPSGTALILLTGHSDPRPMLHLTARRNRFDSAVRVAGNADNIGPEDGWTTEDDRALESAVADTREGMTFFCCT